MADSHDKRAARDATNIEIEAFPIMRGDARMAVGMDGRFEVPLFSQIEGPLWTGCSPVEFPDEYEDQGYDPRSYRPTAYPVHCHWLWVEGEWTKTITDGDLAFPVVERRPRFQAIVNLYPFEDTRYVVPEGTLYKEVQLYDSADIPDNEMIDHIANEVALSCAVGQTTLVHCQAGLNRSAMVAARALMMWKGWTADKAIAVIREKRSPVCLCNSHFERYLRSLDG